MKKAIFILLILMQGIGFSSVRAQDKFCLTVKDESGKSVSIEASERVVGTFDLVKKTMIITEKAKDGGADKVYTASMNSDVTSGTFGMASPTGVEKIITIAGKLVFYPNPVVDVVYLQSTGNLGLITVTNLSGATVKQVTINEETTALDMSGLATGMYFIHTKDAVAKIIKK